MSLWCCARLFPKGLESWRGYTRGRVSRERRTGRSNVFTQKAWLILRRSPKTDLLEYPHTHFLPLRNFQQHKSEIIQKRKTCEKHNKWTRMEPVAIRIKDSAWEFIFGKVKHSYTMSISPTPFYEQFGPTFTVSPRESLDAERGGRVQRCTRLAVLVQAFCIYRIFYSKNRIRVEKPKPKKKCKRLLE